MALATPYPDPIPGIIPFGTVTIFAGAPGVGKTAMLAAWIVAWRDGQPICGKPTNRPTAFYYLAADRQWASHQQWFDAVGFSDIPRYSLADDLAVKLDELQKPHLAYPTFLAALNKLNPLPGSHLFIDPVAPLFIPGDPNKARDVAVGMLRFSRICAERQINITATAHFGKQKGDTKDQYTRPQDRIAGSGAFAGFSDTQIWLIDPQPPQHPYHTLGWNPRHSALEEFKFVRNERGLFDPYNAFKAIDDEQQLDARLIAAVPDEPVSTVVLIEKLCEASGLSPKRIWTYVTRFVREGRIVKPKRGFYQKAKVN